MVAKKERPYANPLVDRESHSRIKSISALAGINMLEFFKRVSFLTTEEIKKLKSK